MLGEGRQRGERGGLGFVFVFVFFVFVFGGVREGGVEGSDGCMVGGGGAVVWRWRGGCWLGEEDWRWDMHFDF